jgi:hypothetical protein
MQFYTCSPCKTHAHPQAAWEHAPISLHLESNWSNHDGTFVQEDIMRKELRPYSLSHCFAPRSWTAKLRGHGPKDEKNNAVSQKYSQGSAPPARDAAVVLGIR